MALSAKAHQNESQSFATLSIIIKDQVQNRLKFIEATIEKSDVNSSLTPTTTLRFEINRQLNYFKIPLPAQLSYVRLLGLDDKNQPVPQLEYSRNLFLVADKDSLKFEFSNSSNDLKFKGKDAAKYTCEYRLNCNDGINNKSFNYYSNLKQYDAAFESLIVQRDSLNRLHSAVINHYAEYLDPVELKVLETDCMANNNKMILGFPYSAFANHLEEQYPAALRFYNKHFGQREAESENISILLCSYEFGDYLLFKERTGVIAANAKTGESFFKDFKFSFMNSVINRDFASGSLKDKLKLLAFWDVDQHQDDYINFLDEAIQGAKPGSFKNSMVAIKKLKGFGAQIKGFQFLDQNGQLVDLKSISGKLIVLDFWFSGCHGCLQMAEKLKSIMKKYKDNPEVLFASLSIDRSREVWIHSLKSELYSSPDELNLLEGKNGQSQFIRAYNIQEYPTLFLISKKGTLISANPPDPRIDENAFLKMIDNNL
ncbi:Thiol-disulfide isomerase or thioredoxin [Mucilaginibacter gossypiicola]|uniref:Thiol-disulfide isomerase or thioredoxin n=2 Tax=Mucilaginibacter gossypiicola TaxID=551995 RepID=A0A1H8DMF8_9SPHI|nr:Thiol-disulfide isomerase or thioredoxin [Mucilaginibacter gossypiicola]